MLLIVPIDKARALLLLDSESSGEKRESAPDVHLLHLMQQKFSDYFAVKEWLQKQQIPFRTEFDGWA
jgi:hypothetical protein